MTNPKRNPIPPGLSTRAKKALQMLGVTDIYHQDPKTLIRDILEAKGVGKSVAYEITGALIARGSFSTFMRPPGICDACQTRALAARTTLKRFKQLEARLEKLAET